MATAENSIRMAIADNTTMTVAMETNPSGAISTTITVTLACSLSFVVLFAMVGNMLVLYVIITHLKCTSYTNAFIASLSTSDLLTTCLCMTTSLVSLLHPSPTIYNKELCIINGFLNGTFSIASTTMLACIAVDRYYVMGNVPRAGPGARTSFLAILLSWSIAVFFSIPWYTIFNLTKMTSPTVLHKEGFHHCMFLFHGKDANEGIIYALFVVAICYMFPIATMLYCCLRLWTVVRQTDSRILPASVQPSHVRFTAELRTAKSVMIMVLLYFITRGPYLFMGLLTSMIGNHFSVAMDTVAMWLFWSNCALNPIIYAIRNPNFSEFLKIKKQTVYKDQNFTNLEAAAAGCQNGMNGRGSVDKNTMADRHGNGSVFAGRGSLSTARGSLSVGSQDSFPSFLFYTSRKSSMMSTVTNATTNTTTSTV